MVRSIKAPLMTFSGRQRSWPKRTNLVSEKNTNNCLCLSKIVSLGPKFQWEWPQVKRGWLCFGSVGCRSECLGAQILCLLQRLCCWNAGKWNDCCHITMCRTTLSGQEVPKHAHSSSGRRSKWTIGSTQAKSSTPECQVASCASEKVRQWFRCNHLPIRRTCYHWVKTGNTQPASSGSSQYCVPSLVCLKFPFIFLYWTVPCKYLYLVSHSPLREPEFRFLSPAPVIARV